MNQKQNKAQAEKYDIYTGFRKENTIEAKLPVGAAFKEENVSYYKIRLMMFPGYTYYLVKNHDSMDRYTIYSRIIANGKNSHQIKFLNPVGSANLDAKLNSYLELKFPMLRAYVYMSLYPQKV
jgi:hypothetical protein